MTSLLSDPFLQLPNSDSVRVVWFTEFQGDRSYLRYGKDLETQTEATTTKLSRVREDQKSRVSQEYTQPTTRDIWRHEAIVNGLTPNQRIPYQVFSIKDREVISSKQFTLASNPTPDTPLKILLTSDHQLMPMTAANLQKVVETVGRVDAVFLAGDLINIPDRASEWFDDSRGGAFFPALQGRANYKLGDTIYKGGEIIQYAPLFPALGNHEVMGRFSTTKSLNDQFYDSIPRSVAKKLYPQEDVKNNSFNSDTYEEIFTLPESESGGKQYYAVTFGDIRLVVLYVTNIWRSPSTEPNVKGRYQESVRDLDSPEDWGYGQHIFEPISQDSTQYRWLQTELASDAFQEAKYKIVMFHHPPHTLGGNIVPPYTDPQAFIEQDREGNIQSVKYEYPIEQDYIIRDLIPLLETAGVQLVYYGHSHLWNRFASQSGMQFLESSNVGNTYGAHLGDNKRPIPPNNSNYSAVGDPNGLEPIIPTIAPLQDDMGNKLPYIASNNITVFSIFNTETGIISSYRFDTRQPDSEVIKFDEFKIIN
ncbi:MAG: metallophosphoesterase family protein [Xenococcaceae cyanobacterium MO_167.B27]|nr:metallophosphoesterase family protein [Xenococcaceae cyanobacterium MO_167.B27]